MTLSAGTATAIITPPVGTWLEGYGGKDHGSVGVHDELYAHALVVDDGDTTVGLVSCDLLGVDRRLVMEARRIAAEATGLAPEGKLFAEACSRPERVEGTRAFLDKRDPAFRSQS